MERCKVVCVDDYLDGRQKMCVVEMKRCKDKKWNYGTRSGKGVKETHLQLYFDEIG